MSKPPLLYLAHRIPYPPNKGDKVRSFNILRHLSRDWTVHLGCFVDDPADRAHLPALDTWCSSVEAVRLSPRYARLLSLRGLLTGEALSLPYYRNARLAAWVREVVRREGVRHAVVFSSTMMQYVEAEPGLDVVADYCDVDSAKWTQYAAERSGPMAWLYRREGVRLLAYETRAARRARAVSFVSEAEAALFRDRAPGVAARVHAFGNGVDAERFSPDPARASPYPGHVRAVVFTGAMDYWPNIDAVTGFVREVWPALAAAEPDIEFWIVGMNPAPEVRALAAGARIRVTGTVPDVRPYLQHAAAVVAPLRIARGVQNKVLEAMAMARPVVVSSAAAEGLDAEDGTHFLVAEDATATRLRLAQVLDSPALAQRLGEAARVRVLARFSWDAHLQALDRLFATQEEAA